MAIDYLCIYIYILSFVILLHVLFYFSGTCDGNIAFKAGGYFVFKHFHLREL